MTALIYGPPVAALARTRSESDEQLDDAILMSLGGGNVVPHNDMPTDLLFDNLDVFPEIDDAELTFFLGAAGMPAREPVEPVAETEEEAVQRAIQLSLLADEHDAGWEIVDPTNRKRRHITTSEDDDLLQLGLDMSMDAFDVIGEEFVRDARPGRLGFHNMGATCYLASALQLLLHARPLVALIESAPEHETNAVSVAFRGLARRMWVDIGSGDPMELAEMLGALHELRNDAFTHDRMEDAHDAIRLILGMLSEAFRTVGGTSPVGDLLTSVVSHSRRCDFCQTQNRVTAHDHEVIVPIVAPVAGAGSVSLYDCMREMREEEVIDHYACAECDGYTSATSSSRVTAPAALMVVVLKRFDSAGNKIVTPVEVPHVLDMQLAMGNPALASNYQLIGIAHHRGESKNSGHYVAQFMHHEHHEWVEANDRAVVSSPPPTVSSTAYVLLYQRIPPTA